MRSLVAALGAFSLLLVVQVVVWRFRRRSGHYVALLALALFVFAAVLAGIAILHATAFPAARLLPATPLAYWNFAMLYGVLVLAYMITYSAVQADSPTMAVLLRIEEAAPRGLSRDELIARLGDDVLIVPRVRDLVASGLAVLERGRYVISGRGSLLARTYMAYRALLRMEKGG